MEGYYGEIKLFGGNFEPENWMFCDGKILSIRGNEALFSLLGIMYGGNGSVTFALPDLRDSEPKQKESTQSGPRYIICIKGEYPPRS
jgi:microcystin-dependent protein